MTKLFLSSTKHPMQMIMRRLMLSTIVVMPVPHDEVSSYGHQGVNRKMDFIKRWKPSLKPALKMHQVI